MKKPTKPKAASCLLLIPVCVIAIAAPVALRLMFSHTYQWQYIVNDFDEYEEDFQAVADYAKEFFVSGQENSGSNSNWIAVGVDTITHESTLYYDGGYLDASREICESVRRIDTEAFNKYAHFDVLRYYDGRIAFETTNGVYALVYSFDDEPPTFVNSPDEDGKYLIKKIKPHWYHVVKKV